MKTFVRVLSLLLVCLMLGATLVACTTEKVLVEGTGKWVTKTDGAGAVDGYDERGFELDNLAEKDLNYLGAEVNMLYWSDVENPEFDVERITGDNVSDAIFDRNGNIERRLNVDLKFDSTPGNVNNRARFVQKVQNVTSSGGGDYDLIATYSRTAGMLAIQGYLIDLNTIQNNHLELEKPWWPPQMIDTVSFGGSLYMLSGDASTNVLHQMHVLYFNKDQFSLKYDAQARAAGFEGNADVSPACEMIYEYAYHYDQEKHPYGGQWTNEKLISYTSNMYDDLNGAAAADGGRYDQDDYYGFCTTAYHVDAFYTGANLRLVDQVEDKRVLIISPDYGSAKTVSLINQLGAWLPTNTCIVQRGDSVPFTKPFEKGNALFITARAHFAEHNLLKVAFDYGILPSAKYDNEQVNYYTCMGNPFTLYGIFHGLDDMGDRAETLKEMTAVLECWASETYRLVTPEVFEVNMQLKYADTQYETDMFEYARSAIVFDLGRIFTNDLSFMSELPSHAACNGASWSSTYGAYIVSLETKLEKIVESFHFDNK